MEEIKRTQMGKKTSLYNLGSPSTASCVMMNPAFILNFAFSRPHKIKYFWIVYYSLQASKCWGRILYKRPFFFFFSLNKAFDKENSSCRRCFEFTKCRFPLTTGISRMGMRDASGTHMPHWGQHPNFCSASQPNCSCILHHVWEDDD